MEIGQGVWVRRHAELDLSLGLVIGERGCLVIDTGTDEVQGAEFAAAIRELTDLPWSVVLTHAHFDHSFGTAAFGRCDVWAHPACRTDLERGAKAQRQEWAGYYRERGEARLAERIEGARVVLPDRFVDSEQTIDLGGRVVEVFHPGSGHTGHDLAVHVPDAGVLFAGDLVEHGAPPSFSDSYPLAWPQAVDRLLDRSPDQVLNPSPDQSRGPSHGRRTATVVPGHGDPVEADFVRAQREELRVVAELGVAVRDGTLSLEEALARSPYPESFTAEAVNKVT
jgi:glyoxylase-like metal-dependent hydrolase (beta-lactamase superfamily II)